MNLRKCHYCGENPNIRVKKDRNIVGTECYKATIICTLCHNQIETYGDTATAAIELCQKYWNWGVKGE